MTRLAGALLPLVLLTACTGSSSTAAPSTPTVATSPAASLPACAAVFTAGATIPADSDGRCLDADGTTVVLGTWACSDGRHLLGDRRGWGFTGQAVHVEPAATSPGYRAAYRTCTG